MNVRGIVAGLTGVLGLLACAVESRGPTGIATAQRDQSSSAGASGASDGPLECKNLFRPFRVDEPDDPAERAYPISGTLTDDDPVQTGIFDTEPPEARPGGVTCPNPRPLPGIVLSETPRFDAYVFKNWTGAAACVSVYMETNAYRSPTGGARPAVYLGAFDPDDIAKNYIAAGDGILVSLIHANVPKDAEFTVVVFGENTAARAGYALYVGGCGLEGGGTDAGAGSSTSSGGSSSGGESSGGSDAGSSGESSGSSGKTW